MNFLNHFSTNPNFQPYIRSKLLPNMFIIPYVRYRLNFARMVTQTLSQEKIDVILVDLPDFLGVTDFIDLSIDLFPFLRTMYIKRDKHYYFYSYSPSDAAVVGMIWAILHKIDYYCIDDPDLIRYPKNALFVPKLKLKDDQFVFTEGLESYFAQVWPYLDFLWWGDLRKNKYANIYRASFIVDQLLEHSSSSKNILFICEFRLWWLIKNILRNKFAVSGISKNFYTKSKARAIFAIEAPVLLWIKGIIDDYPFITYRFFRSLLRDEVEFEGKLALLNQLLDQFFKQTIRNERLDVSIRRLLIFKRYLSNTMTLNQRIMPLPAAHLLSAAEATLGNKVAKKLAEKLFEFPSLAAIGHGPLSDFFYIDPERIGDQAGNFELPDLFDTPALMEDEANNIAQNFLIESMADRKYWAEQNKVYITHPEDNIISKKVNSDTWATSYDKKLRYHTSLYIKDFFNKRRSLYKKSFSYGSLKDGIDWKATLIEFSKGFSHFIVKEKKSKGLEKWPKYCPVVYIFSERNKNEVFRMVYEGNITDKLRTLGINVLANQNYPPPDAIYTIFRSIKRMEYVLNDHIRIELLSALAVTFTSRYVWILRYQELSKHNPKNLCRLSFSDDNELAPFEGHDKIIAWAIKYAEDVILILSYPGWKPSMAIVNYANQKKVRLMIKSIHILPEHLIKRLKINFYISNDLKKSPYGEEIVKRYIRKMGFKI